MGDGGNLGIQVIKPGPQTLKLGLHLGPPGRHLCPVGVDGGTLGPDLTGNCAHLGQDRVVLAHDTTRRASAAIW